MTRRNYCYILFLFFLSLGMSSQKSKADQLFAKAEYFRAIPKYKKSIRSSDVQSRKQSLIGLAHCYRILNDYTQAAHYYKAAIVLDDVPADTYYYYGSVLKSQGQYDEALRNFKIYLQTNPKDGKAANAHRSSAEINYLRNKPHEYTLKNAEQINTKGSEFCAYPLDQGLVYTGEKQTDMVENSKNALNGQPYLGVLYAPQNNSGYGKSKSFSAKVNTSYHDGPVSFSADGNSLYLTRVNYVKKKDQGFVNYAKLYVMAKEGRTWGKAVPFPYNSDAYSCAHASISADGNTLFFASDMPGGFGGKDLWMCRRTAGGWDKPVNLGADINTSGDEMFPYIRKDGVLFFSSNGLPGFGGLDVFSARLVNQVWLLKRNEGLDINSSADDFGMVFSSDSTGFVSSNREGGKGGDDIYAFGYKNKYTRVEGYVLLTKNPEDPAAEVNVYLLNENLQRVDSTKTDRKGYFCFNDLETDKHYLAQLENEDVTFKQKARYYLSDKDGQLVRVTHRRNGMDFVFSNLPVEINELSDVYGGDGDGFHIAGNIVYGSNPARPVAGKKVTIINKFRDIVEETSTDQLGAFAFRNLAPDQDYFLSIDGDSLPDGVKVTLTNKNGKEVKVLQAKAKGRYEFNLLAVDKTALEELTVDDSELTMTLKGSIYDQNKKPLANARMAVFDKDKVIQNIISDEKGKFSFRNLHADKDYLFSVEGGGDAFNYVTKIYIGDAQGNIYKEVERGKQNKFEYHLLDVDKTALGEFSVDDPWLDVLKMKNAGKEVALTITENITYELDDYKPDETGINILDKVISVLKTDDHLMVELSSHTDSRGSDQYNLLLSQKRARAAVDYMVSKGISVKRLKAIGYGETRLLNGCANGVECSDEQHAINRRTEFRILGTSRP